MMTSDSSDGAANGNPKTVVTVYTREDCHLCAEAIDTVRRVSSESSRSVDVRIVDVDENPELRSEYGDRVPYVLVDGTPAFKFRVDERELRSKLEM